MRQTDDAPRSAFTAALDAAFTESGTSLTDAQEALREREIRLSVSTLSYWRSGARRPDGVRSLAAVHALEEVLALPHGALTKLIGGRSGSWGRISPLEPPTDEDARVQRMFHRLELPPPDSLRYVSVQETIDIDERLAISTISTELLVQCVGGTVDALGFVDVAPEPTRLAPVLVANSGRSAEPVRDEHEGIFGYRVELERPLYPGETAMLSMDFSFPAGHPLRRSHSISLRRRTREVLQWFRFAEGAAPHWFEEHEFANGRTKSVTLEEPTSVHRIRSDFGPGRVEAGWGWVDD